MADAERRPCGRPVDDVVDLVLGALDGQRRAAVIGHLLQCPDCRREADGLAAAVADLLPAVPAVQPPIGFEAAVLGRLEPSASPRGRWSPRWLAVAAGLVALALAAGVLLGRAADGDGLNGGDTAHAVTLRRTRDDSAVGTVSLSDLDGRAVMVVALVDAPGDVSYTCRLHLADGRSVDAATWPAVASGAWVVDLPAGVAPDAVERVELVVAGSGRIWSSASV